MRRTRISRLVEELKGISTTAALRFAAIVSDSERDVALHSAALVV